MFSSNPDDDPLTFVDDLSPAPNAENQVWRILLVDDEPDVHQTTRLALKGVVVEGRLLEFVHAYSAAEARACLKENANIAVALLDVVMESDDSGLRLVRFIREELGNHSIRIILRTGQPGYAPEIDTIRSYDINDYKSKSELTRVRLFTCLAIAVRSYSQIHQLEVTRRGLELIVAASTELSKPRGIRRFAEGVITQICALLGVREEGIVCAASETTGATPFILAAAGLFSSWIGGPMTSIPDERVRRELALTLTSRRHRIDTTTCLFFSVPGDQSLVVFVDANHEINDTNRELLEVFCSNIAVAFENTQLYQRVSSLAYEDSLLNLPNRNSFLARIDQRPGNRDTLALVDIDDFADINSILDQDFGDAVLRLVADRLRSTFSPLVVIARIGSDVFGVLGPRDEVNAERISDVFSPPFEMNNESFRISATTGLMRLDDSALKGVEILKNASVALKQAKSFNRGKAVFFEMSHATAARERMQMLSQLRTAFSAERLFLVYQPFIDLATGRVVGAEALLRWRTEQGEFIPPDRFIPLAEQSGLMVAIGDWVTRSALEFLQRLVDLGHDRFRMAINVSHVQFREPDFVERLVAAMNKHGINPANVEIELTESVAIDNIELISKRLAAVRESGVSIAIDDFGTGYSSLNILRQMDVDRLKIDRAFVSGQDGLNEDYSIAGMVLQLAGQLGLETIAEGVETQVQYDKLLQLGCCYGQGYFFSPPLASDQFEAFLRER